MRYVHQSLFVNLLIFSKDYLLWRKLNLDVIGTQVHLPFQTAKLPGWVNNSFNERMLYCLSKPKEIAIEG